MTESHNDKHRELMKCITKSLDDYHTTLMGFGKQELVEMADKIAATSAAYNYLCSRGFYDDELGFLLQFKNPLKIVADCWRGYQTDIDDEMGFALDSSFHLNSGKKQVDQCVTNTPGRAATRKPSGLED